MNRLKNAFTVIELIFVIVILGILSAVAIPKLGATKESADIGKGRSDVMSIRSAILSDRQSRIVQGCRDYIHIGTANWTCTPGNGENYAAMDQGSILFGGLLTYPPSNESGVSGKWSGTAGSGTYKFRVGDVETTFDYNQTSGKFTCTAGADYCDDLTR